MTENDTFYQKSLIKPIGSVLLLIGFWIVFAVLGSLLAFGVLLVANIPLSELMTFTQHPENYPSGWYAMMGLQVFSSPLPFIAAAYLVWVMFEKRTLTSFFSQPIERYVLLIVVVLVIGSLPLNGYIYELNKAMHLPEALKGVETWMRDQEDALAKVTEFMTEYTGVGKLVIALLVIALSAGVAEELFFRGVLQNILLRWFKNPHVAIWISAVVFSAIHMQFYGFFPRVLLGAMFGYLYWWSNNLIVPIFAHFVNNGFAIIAAYMSKNQGVEIDISEKEVVPLPAVGASLVLTVAILWFLNKRKIRRTVN